VRIQSRRIICRLSSLRSTERASRPFPHRQSDCPRNPTTIQCRVKSCQSTHPTGFPDDLHRWKCPFGRRRQESCRQRVELRSTDSRWRLSPHLPLSSKTRNSMCLPLGITPLSAHADTEDKKLRKDPFGGPCFEGPLRIRDAFPNEVPWPGQLKALHALLNIRCRTNPRDANNTTG
jgi:hypothetical protein